MLLFPLSATRKQTMKITSDASRTAHEPWNKGKLIGQKPPLKLHEIWTVRTQLRMTGKTRELALFNLAIDSKLRGCDLVALRVRDIAHGNHVVARASVVCPAKDPRAGALRADRPDARGRAGLDLKRPRFPMGIISSPVGRAAHHTCPPVSTRASSSDGSDSWALIRRSTGRTRCVGPRRR